MDKDPQAAIAECLSRNEKRQKVFEKELQSLRRRFVAEFRGSAARSQAQRTTSRSRLADLNLTKTLIGRTPEQWTFRLPSDVVPDVCKIGRLTGETRFTDPDMFVQSETLVQCLSPKGKSAAGSNGGLPPGWKQFSIEETEELANVENALELDGGKEKTVDIGRVYFYHEESGKVSFAPPPGSHPLVVESFYHFGRS